MGHLELTNLNISGTTDIPHEFPNLKSISLQVKIDRGEKDLPLFDKIFVTTCIVVSNDHKFWTREEIEKQVNLKYLSWSSNEYFKLDKFGILFIIKCKRI